MFPRFDMHGDMYSMLKSQTTHYCVIRREVIKSTRMRRGCINTIHIRRANNTKTLTKELE